MPPGARARPKVSGGDDASAPERPGARFRWSHARPSRASRSRVATGRADRAVVLCVRRHGDVARMHLRAARLGAAAARATCANPAEAGSPARSTHDRAGVAPMAHRMRRRTILRWHIRMGAHVAVFEPRARDGTSERDGGQREGTTQRMRRIGGREGREAEPGSFHYFYAPNVMPSIDEIFGSLVIYALVGPPWATGLANARRVSTKPVLQASVL